MEVQARSTSEQKISEMVRRIVEGFHPGKIILFGSYARGAAGPDMHEAIEFHIEGLREECLRVPEPKTRATYVTVAA